ncbi:hypothetical protein [Cyanobium sp. ATX-6F1]|uniref:hypothetical protein n=1 Tax=Cyanobium sp. ATX-6F1 TaxID=3137388 RepID=UPI0039BE2336
MLPLATVAALVMVLSSLSLLGTALAGRQAQAADLRRLQGEDALNSAAQLIAAQLLPGSPPTASLQVPLGEANATVQLLSWQPGADSALMRLQLQADPAQQANPAAQAGQAAGRTGSFRLMLDPSTAQVRGLRMEGP